LQLFKQSLFIVSPRFNVQIDKWKRVYIIINNNMDFFIIKIVVQLAD